MDRVTEHAPGRAAPASVPRRGWQAKAGLAFVLWVLYAVFLAWWVPIGPVTMAESASGLERAPPALLPSGLSAPLGSLVAQGARIVPAAEGTTRAHLVALLLGLVALAHWFRRVELGLSDLLPIPQARASARDKLHARLASLGGTGSVALSSVAVTALVTASGAALTALALVAVAAALHAQRVRPSDAEAGLLGAFLAGLCAGVDPVVLAIAMPAGLIVWWRALRAGERWPVLAPFLFACGTLVLLSALTFAQAPPAFVWTRLFGLLTLAELRKAIAGLGGPAVWLALAHLVESLGIVATLLAVVGLVVMAARAPAWAALHVYGLWVALFSWAQALHGAATTAALVKDAPSGLSFSGAQARLPWAVALTLRAEPAPALVFLLLCATPIAAGILRFSSALGRARLPAAVAVAVIAAAIPLLSLERLPPRLAAGAARVELDRLPALPPPPPRNANPPAAKPEGAAAQGKIPRSR